MIQPCHAIQIHRPAATVTTASFYRTFSITNAGTSCTTTAGTAPVPAVPCETKVGSAGKSFSMYVECPAGYTARFLEECAISAVPLLEIDNMTQPPILGALGVTTGGRAFCTYRFANAALQLPNAFAVGVAIKCLQN